MIWIALFTACTGNPGKDKPSAVVEDVPAEVATAPSDATASEAAASKTLAVDKSQSKLGAIGAKLTADHPIVFHEYTGEVGLDDAGTVLSIAYEADVASLEADHPKLTKHLLNEDFLDTVKHPKSTFSSTEIKAGSDVEGMSHTVTGDLTIRGKTKRVTFPAKIETGSVVKASAEFTIDRRDFDVVYPGRPDDLVKNEVLMQIALTAPNP